MHDTSKVSEKIDYQTDSCSQTQTAYDKEAAAEEKFEVLSKKIDHVALGRTLSLTLQLSGSQVFADHVPELYRASTPAQQVETLNQILHTVGPMEFFAAGRAVGVECLERGETDFKHAQASRILPAQVGKIFKMLEPQHPELQETLCQVYVRSVLLMNTLAPDAISSLLIKFDKI